MQPKIDNMKNTKVFKRTSHEGSLHGENIRKSRQNLWGNRSLIFSHTNKELFQGLLDLTKHQNCKLSESFEEEETDKNVN